VRNRQNFRLLRNETQLDRITSKIKKATYFNEDLLGVHLLRKEVILNKPIILGFSVLDQSKLLMYDFHYNFMLKKFKRENIDLLFTDTDSLCYHIRKQNPYDIMLENKERFDLSVYDKNTKMYNEENKGKVGCFKNESPNDPIVEFIGLRSKLYYYKTKSEKMGKRCKGVKRTVVEKEISRDNYHDTLTKRTDYSISQNSIRSYKHTVYSETTIKTALNCCDDKMYICDNNINCFSIGHYKNTI